MATKLQINVCIAKTSGLEVDSDAAMVIFPIR
jgi:hypothetical protein